MVGLAGFEPATPCSQSRCAAKLRYSPCSHCAIHWFGCATEVGAGEVSGSPGIRTVLPVWHGDAMLAPSPEGNHEQPGKKATAPLEEACFEAEQESKCVGTGLTGRVGRRGFEPRTCGLRVRAESFPPVSLHGQKSGLSRGLIVSSSPFVSLE